MSARTIFITASGRGVDLLNPCAADIDWDVFSEHLAKEIRFNGATPDVAYSVAEHSARGADAILKETGDRELAAYFLTHDGPEHLLKDDPTPKKNAIAEIAFEKFGILAPQILACFAEITERHDLAVHTAAGLAWPPPAQVVEMVKYWDRRMLVTEWRDLMHGVAHPDWDDYRDIAPLPDVIVPWRWQTAKFALLNRCHALLPSLRVPAFAHGKTRSTSA